MPVPEYLPCNCGSFKPCNPAPPHYHMNLDSTVDVKKKFGGLAEITFLQLVSFLCVFLHSRRFFSSELASEICDFPAVISANFFFFFFFLQEYTETEGGKRSGCLKVCGRHVTCCTLLRLIFVSDPCFKSHSFDLFT